MSLFQLRHRCSPRCRITLARIVDVLGVAAPHGPAVVWYATRRVHARMDERLPGVSHYAVCLGDARAFCSGPESGGGGTVRPACHCYVSGAGARQRFDATLARIVDVLGVAAPHDPAVVWYAIRRVHERMGGTLLVVLLCSLAGGWSTVLFRSGW
ncbi:putative transmembrane protein [Toxoplasma gondii VEG]|uniref:Transmembrane protein n=1 Tax=Toxoplasma gondii (strain ATCC 50861 / VEG) TaxID=432359 RepID=V4Z6M9_TOXGV|nr:putative transmembrane protein [Toxoplasma gondii VEG]